MAHRSRVLLGWVFLALAGGCLMERDATDQVSQAVDKHHRWNRYHWARTSNPFTVKLGNNVSSGWSSYLNEASSDWGASSVLDTNVVSGGSDSSCTPTLGRVEV